MASDLQAILDAHSELTFILARDGSIEVLNQRAAEFFGERVLGKRIFDLTEAPEPARIFFARCLGTNQTMVGSLCLIGQGAQTERFRVYGRMMGRPDCTGETRVFLRCASAHDERFSVLAKQIAGLNEEIRKRRHVQSVLEESVRERELLVREIHHRVKNNIAMLASMIHLARLETDSSEAQSILMEAGRRVSAMASIQQVLYQSDNVRIASAHDLIHTLISHVRDTIPPTARIETDIDDSQIPTDFSLPLTLIINELVTNAVKHGLRNNQAGIVTINFGLENGVFQLCVHNPGVGFAIKATGRRASGLGLVRGLVRQLHGTFDIESNDGVTCIVTFEERDNEEVEESDAS